VHLTNEWGTDESRHGHTLPAVLVHGVVQRVFHTTISGTGTVVGARFHPGRFRARFGRDAAALTGRVEHVMARSPWSGRTTQRVFRRYVGVPVKWVLCRYRLQQAALEIETYPDVDFADLAVRLGWYDQAHFINDFRSMLGCMPGEYPDRTLHAAD
jgi:AraC-like DNA-binding protein